MDQLDLYTFLRRGRLGVLGSLSPEGWPQAALVGYAVTPQLEIVFDTVKTSRKYRNLRAQARCSFVAGWDGEQTIQLEGYAEELVSPRLARCLEVYLQVWDEAAARLRWPDITHFVVTPTWIRYSDFGERPPLVFELSLGVDVPWTGSDQRD